MSKSLHIPLADVLKLASLLQYGRDTSHGPGVSAAQVAKAERVMRRLIKEHMSGKWDKQK